MNVRFPTDASEVLPLLISLNFRKSQISETLIADDENVPFTVLVKKDVVIIYNGSVTRSFRVSAL